jgi:polysaccharide transporter, PST family
MLAKIVKKIGQNRSPELLKIVTNTLWLMADNILRMGIGLVVGVWVARYLGPSQFGLLNYAISIAGMFNVIAKAGLDEIIIRDLVSGQTSQPEILGTGFALKLASGSLAFLLSIGTILSIPNQDILTPWLVSIVALGMVFQSLDTIDLWFQSQVQSKKTVYAKNVAYLITTAVKVLLIVQKAPLIAFATVIVFEIAISSINLTVIYHLAGYSVRVWKINIALAIKFLQQSWPNILTGLSVTIYMRIDQIMLGNLIGNEAVGNYAVGVRLAEIWYFIPIAIVSSIAPKIFRSKQESQEQYDENIQKALDLLVLTMYVISIGMTCFSSQIIAILYGTNYTSSSPILAIYVWSNVFVALGLVRNTWVTTEGLFRFGSVTTFVGAILNIILNLVLIPRYAAAGAALATVISYGVSDYLILFLYPPSQKLGWMMTKALCLNFAIDKFQFFRNR